MSLDKALKGLKFDKRMIHWNLTNGQLSEQEYKKYLEDLKDVGNNVDLINLESSDDENQSQH